MNFKSPLEKMRNLSLIAFVIGISFIPESYATQVGFSAFGQDRSVRDSSDVVLTGSSSLVWVGTFANESFSLNGNRTFQENISDIQSNGGWEQFGFDTSSGVQNAGVTGSFFSLSASGRISGDLTDTSSGATKADYFNNGKLLYVWIFNAQTPGAASQMGIFRASSASAPWVFPTNGNLPDTVTLSAGTDGAPVIAAIAGVGSGASSDSDFTLNLTGIPPVPEPSTFAAGAMLMLAAMGVRRRRRG